MGAGADDRGTGARTLIEYRIRPMLAAIKGFTDRYQTLVLCEKQLKLEKAIVRQI
jgi:hypothetical protein